MATAYLVEDSKRCTKCFATKPESEFPKKSPTKRRAQCAKCLNAYNRGLIHANPERRRHKNTSAKNWRDNNLEHVRAYAHARRLRLEYGITRSDYMALLERHGGVCGICKRPPKEPHLVVDHCHDTGRIRGLLCSPCNLGLGKLGDTLEAITSALNYLAAEPVPQSFHDTLRKL